MRSIFMPLASFLLSACVGHSADCSAGAGQNGCVPGTKEYEQLQQTRENSRDAKLTAEIDDARCFSYGPRTSSAYAECRRKAADEQRLLIPAR